MMICCYASEFCSEEKCKFSCSKRGESEVDEAFECQCQCSCDEDEGGEERMYNCAMDI